MALDQMPDTVANRSDGGRRPYTQPKISSKASARVVDGRHDAVYGLVPTLARLAGSGLIQPQMAGIYPPSPERGLPSNKISATVFTLPKTAVIILLYTAAVNRSDHFSRKF